MALNLFDKKKILFMTRGILRAVLPRGYPAIAIVYDDPCPTHDVYRICVGPPVGVNFTVNVGHLFQRLIGWTDKYEEESKTYIKKVRVEGAFTLVQFCFINVKCAIRIYHVGGTMEFDTELDNSVYTFHKGELRQAHCKQVGFNTAAIIPCGHQAAQIMAHTHQAEYLLAQMKKELAEKSDEEPAEEPAEEQSGMTTDMGDMIRSYPEQVTTLLFMYVTLLGGTTTVAELEGLSQEAKLIALQYLRPFYRNKFLHGKERTGKRPSFVQQYLSPKKA